MSGVGERSRVTPAPGDLIGGRYELVETVGAGGMATVWEAHDHVLGRPVAVKILHAHLAADHAVVRRFRREAVAAARLAHPNVVAVYDTVAATDDEPFEAIVMELVSGRTLRDVLDDGPLDEARARRLGDDLLGALECAHRQGLVHRDIKPANVLLTPDGTARLTDFGIAKAESDNDLTVVGTLVGTAAYLAPEQVGGGTVDARSDLYAVATVLYEAVTGEVPFRAESAASTALARLHQAPAPLGEQRSGLSPEFCAAVMRGLQLDPDDRPPSASAMREELARRGSHLAQRSAAARTTSVARVEPDDTAPQPIVGAAAPAPGPAPAARRRRRAGRARRSRRSVAGRVVLTLLLVGPLVLIGVLVADGPHGDGTPTTTAAPRYEPIGIAAATAFDPLGDGRESDAAAPRVLDGDPATEWTTERYNARDLGVKDGVGLVLDLGATRRLGELRLRGSAGWSGTIHTSRGSLASGDGPPATGAIAVSDAPADLVVALDDATASSVLIWITDLGPSDGSHRVTIAEAEITGRPVGGG